LFSAFRLGCFAALLGSPDDRHWSIAPIAAHPKVSRRYREGTLASETEFSTTEGAAERLGLKRSTLQNKMRKLNISKADYADRVN
jgi:DNA-binding NtrC family response regulator